MPEIKFGDQVIKFEFEINNGLKHHYLRINADKTVVVKGRKISLKEAEFIILKKAKWILSKQELVKDIATTSYKNGMSIPFMGKNLIVQIVFEKKKNYVGKIVGTAVVFSVPEEYKERATEALPKLVENFYRYQSQQIIPDKLAYWSKFTGFKYTDLKFKKLKSKWGSCSSTNAITINIFALKLKIELIDYLLIHELCHVKEKNHKQGFWREVARFLPNYKILDKEIRHTKI